MKKSFLVSVLSFLFMINIAVATEEKDSSFADVNVSDDYYEASKYLQTFGIKGEDDGSFKPEKKINRAEFLTIVLRTTLEDKEIYGENCFPDVQNQWFAKFVCTAKRKGIVNGYEDGNYRPENIINFAEMTVIVSKMLELNINEENKTTWYEPFVKEVSDSNAIPTTITDLNQEITKAETAEIIYRLKQKIKNKDSMIFENDNLKSKKILQTNILDDTNFIEIPSDDYLPESTFFLLSYKKNDYILGEIKKLINEIKIPDAEVDQAYSLLSDINDVVIFSSVVKEINILEKEKNIIDENICFAVLVNYSKKETKTFFDFAPVKTKQTSSDNKYFWYSPACESINFGPKTNNEEKLQKISNASFKDKNDLSIYFNTKKLLNKIPEIKKFWNQEAFQKNIMKEISSSDKTIKLTNDFINSLITQAYKTYFVKLISDFEFITANINFTKDKINIKSATKFATKNSVEFASHISHAEIDSLNSVGKEDVMWTYKNKIAENNIIFENTQRTKGIKNTINKNYSDNTLKQNIDSFDNNLIFAFNYNKNDFTIKKLDDFFEIIIENINKDDKTELEKELPILKQFIKNIKNISFGIEIQNEIDEEFSEKDICFFSFIENNSEILKQGLMDEIKEFGTVKDVENGTIFYSHACENKYDTKEKITKALNNFDKNALFEIYFNKKIVWDKIEKPLIKSIKKELGKENFKFTFDETKELIYDLIIEEGYNEDEKNETKKLLNILDKRIISKIPMYFSYKMLTQSEKIQVSININENEITENITIKFDGDEKQELATRYSNYFQNSFKTSKIFANDETEFSYKQNAKNGISINQVNIKNYDFIYFFINLGGMNILEFLGNFKKEKEFEKEIENFEEELKEEYK